MPEFSTDKLHELVDLAATVKISERNNLVIRQSAPPKYLLIFGTMLMLTFLLQTCEEYLFAADGEFYVISAFIVAMLGLLAQLNTVFQSSHRAGKDLPCDIKFLRQAEEIIKVELSSEGAQNYNNSIDIAIVEMKAHRLGFQTKIKSAP
jgi:hypothetical protein